uniref:RNA helicase n=1 Tax=Tetradesmus obliquus TaxID=3088 RepID=A0A383WG42_TETOB|eukprot:jgi/Sobl393_1/16973/SZX76391.1
MNFQETGLDPRILRALAKQGFSQPTAVQAATIPAALEGKDIVARARTGSGKTLAYLLPALQRIVTSKSSRQPWQVLVLVPTRELCDQVAGEAKAVAAHCGVPISVTPLLGATPVAQRAAVAAAGALVVATPARIATAMREGWLQPSLLSQSLQVLVLDEADLLLSYGYAEDLQALAVHIPRSAQCMLMSATSSAEVEQLQQLVLHNPVTLNLLAAAGSAAAAGAAGDSDAAAAADGGAAGFGDGGAGSAAEISHFSYSCAADDRRLVVLALLKLGLLRKKVLIFAGSVEAGVGLRLFLESFGLRLGCLHAELPVNSRSHILASFNKGLFDFLIAVDDVHARDRTAAAAAAAAAAAEADVGRGRKRKRKQQDKPGKQQQQQKARKDEEFGVTRGIDFKGVRSIINFDIPDSVQGYVHRVGRTGRAGQSGLALTLLTPQDDDFRQELQQALQQQQQQQQSAAAAAGVAAAAGDSSSSSSDDDSSGSEDEGEGGGRRSRRKAAQDRPALRPFSRLSRPSLEALRYRAEDVARTITRGAVREARARELQRELLNSEKLADYFEEHEAERALLKHDKPMHRKAGNAPHLKHVPAYLKDPAAVAAAQAAAAAAAAVAAAQRRPKQKGPKNKRVKRADPLKAVGDAAAAAPAAAGAPGAAAAAPPAAAAGGVFMRAPKKGGSAVDEELTELEKRALAKPLKPSKAKALAGVGGPAYKAQAQGKKVAAVAAGGKYNVKKVRPTMGAGAKSRR